MKIKLVDNLGIWIF